LKLSFALILSGLAALLAPMLSYSHYLYVFESSIKAISAMPGSNITMPDLPMPLYVAYFVTGVVLVLLGGLVERRSTAGRPAVGGPAASAAQSLS